MNYIWVIMLALSFVSAAMQGNMQEMSNAILLSAGSAVELCIRLAGTMLLWGGLMNIASESGLTDSVSRFLRPLLRLVFPRMDLSSAAAGAISMNVTANLLGLGNAATPLGLEAMRQLKLSSPGKTASDDMVKFVVLNSAALHLLPTTVAMLRSSAGASAPFDIMPASWLTSCLALTAGLTAATIMLSAQRIGGVLHKRDKRLDTAHSGARHSFMGIF